MSLCKLTDIGSFRLTIFSAQQLHINKTFLCQNNLISIHCLHVTALDHYLDTGIHRKATHGKFIGLQRTSIISIPHIFMMVHQRGNARHRYLMSTILDLGPKYCSTELQLGSLLRIHVILQKNVDYIVLDSVE